MRLGREGASLVPGTNLVASRATTTEAGWLLTCCLTSKPDQIRPAVERHSGLRRAGSVSDLHVALRRPTRSSRGVRIGMVAMTHRHFQWRVLLLHV